MKTMKLYASWGVLAHEFQPVYTYGGPVTAAYDEVDVEWPDDLPLSFNRAGEPLVDIGKVTYMLRELLSNWGDEPALIWFDGQKNHRRMLKTKKEK